MSAVFLLYTMELLRYFYGVVFVHQQLHIRRSIDVHSFQYSVYTLVKPFI